MSDFNEYQDHVVTMIAPVVTNMQVRRFRPHVERDDIMQECLIWVWRHPNKIKEWLQDKENYGEGYISRALQNLTLKYCQKMKAQRLGYSVDDVYYWAKGDIEQMLPAVFDHEKWAESPQLQGEGGRSKRPPSEGGNWIASLADLSAAVATLEPAAQAELRFIYEKGWTQRQLAALRDLSTSAISRRIDSHLRKVHELVGGRRPGNFHEEDCECGEFVGTRRAMSNAQAAAITEGNYDQ